MAYSQTGRGSIPSWFGGRLWLGGNAQTLLKAEVDDRAPAGREMALARLLESLLMSEVLKPQCSLIDSIPAWLRMQPLHPPTRARSLSSPAVADSLKQVPSLMGAASGDFL